MAKSYIENAKAVREAMDVAGSLLSEENALMCVHLYRSWVPGVTYKEGDYLVYGKNNVGDPQLYKVVQGHTSQSNWLPDSTPALYTAIGLTDEGYPIWSKPTGTHDAYNEGDIVEYEGKLYVSKMDGNVWSPSEYPSAWEEYVE